jgi:hypothetical protein
VLPTYQFVPALICWLLLWQLFCPGKPSSDVSERSPVDSSPASHSEGPGFRSRLGDQPSRPTGFVLFLILFQTCGKTVHRLRHDSFLPNPFQFTYRHLCYRLATEIWIHVNNIVTRLSVAIDGVWIGNRIYWTDTNNYDRLVELLQRSL